MSARSSMSGGQLVLLRVLYWQAADDDGLSSAARAGLKLLASCRDHPGGQATPETARTISRVIG